MNGVGNFFTLFQKNVPSNDDDDDDDNDDDNHS